MRDTAKTGPINPKVSKEVPIQYYLPPSRFTDFSFYGKVLLVLRPFRFAQKISAKIYEKIFSKNSANFQSRLGFLDRV